MKEMTLNVYENGGFERLFETVALNTCGSECLWKKVVALNAYERNDFKGLWIWMSMKVVALNAYGEEWL